MQIPETFLKPGKFVSHVQHRYRLSHIGKVDDCESRSRIARCLVKQKLSVATNTQLSSSAKQKLLLKGCLELYRNTDHLRRALRFPKNQQNL